MSNRRAAIIAQTRMDELDSRVRDGDPVAIDEARRALCGMIYRMQPEDLRSFIATVRRRIDADLQYYTRET